MLPILKHTCIYLNRDVQCTVIYMYIYLYTVCEGIQRRIRIPLFKNCERSEPGKIFENLTVVSEASKSIWEKLAPPPPPNCRKVKVRLFVFFTEEDRLFIFSIFKVRIFISTKCQPTPSESNGRPPIAYAKWKYVTWGKKRRTRNTCNASRWPVPARLWKNSVRHTEIYSYQSCM